MVNVRRYFLYQLCIDKSRWPLRQYLVDMMIGTDHCSEDFEYKTIWHIFMEQIRH